MKKSKNPSYPLRLEDQLEARVRKSAIKKKWSLATWYREACLLMLKKDDAEEFRSLDLNHEGQL